ncbi:glycoside hydrolase family 1 protein [Leuconostoc citreum]|uniref:glycoside hydrolase family 1 protein n=1 Tax=Leuconostoc citreum TaxID=33964 RepID=UPI00054260DC|nr:glycoside hydrolase family 1 protein [Leuconostoc citreum]MDV8932192.1 glycoside hydrolase family 1 protein [Leuconostoc citreum]CDX66410.1 6-phospho-beta-glucosidase [Leuconostoc citreum]
MVKKRFLWGNSVSSMQTEGAWNIAGKGPSVYDIKQASQEQSDFKIAIDSYHKYKEDFVLMKHAGMNAYRFQISWSRVIPDGDGAVNEQGLKFYEQFIDDLIAQDITPIVCLYHFDMPLSLAQRFNGLISDHVREAFVRFAKIVIDKFAKKVPYWIPINEQNCMTFAEGFGNSGYLVGEQTLTELYKIANNSLIAYVEIADYIHHFSNLKVGGMVAYQEMYPASQLPNDVMYTRKAMEFINEDFLSFFAAGKRSPEVIKYMQKHGFTQLLDELEQAALNYPNITSDFLAFSYYYSLVIDSNLIDNKRAPNTFMSDGHIANVNLKTSDFGWQIDAIGFRNTITKMHNRYNLPILAAENGIGAIEHYDGKNMINDDYRIAYHQEHINEMCKAIEIDGANVIGYLGWGLIDIPSSKGNVEKRYGLVYVNRTNKDTKDLKRIPKKSYFWFKKFIAEKDTQLSQKGEVYNDD